MKDRSKLRERFLRDHVSIQLGNIASNLARVANFITMEMEQTVMNELLDESKAMIEWAAPSATLEQQFTLVELQRCLARWRFAWSDIASDEIERSVVANKAQQWSNQLITMSGLLDGDPIPAATQPEKPTAVAATFS